MGECPEQAKSVPWALCALDPLLYKSLHVPHVLITSARLLSRAVLPADKIHSIGCVESIPESWRSELFSHAATPSMMSDVRGMAGLPVRIGRGQATKLSPI
jgi:hypothetical protein